mgnify:CR=1 FL=1
MILHDFRPATTPPRVRFALSPQQRMLLMPIGDVHYGAPGFPADRFRRHIEWGCERGAYFLGMGDVMEFTSRSQRGHLANMRDSQREFVDQANTESIAQLAKSIECSKGRWIGWLEGDHYHEFLDGTTSDQRLCQALGGAFLGTSTLLLLRLEDPRRMGKRGVRTRPSGNGCDVTVFAHHGRGGGRLAGSGLNIMEYLVKGVEADIYLMAHNHAKVTAPMDRLYRTANGYLYHRTKILARTGGWLRGYLAQRPLEGRPARESRGSYVEQAAYVPSTLGGLVFSIGSKRVPHRDGPQRTDFCIPDIHLSV